MLYFVFIIYLFLYTILCLINNDFPSIDPFTIKKKIETFIIYFTPLTMAIITYYINNNISLTKPIENFFKKKFENKCNKKAVTVNVYKLDDSEKNKWKYMIDLFIEKDKAEVLNILKKYDLFNNFDIEKKLNSYNSLPVSKMFFITKIFNILYLCEEAIYEIENDNENKNNNIILLEEIKILISQLICNLKKEKYKIGITLSLKNLSKLVIVSLIGIAITIPFYYFGINVFYIIGSGFLFLGSFSFILLIYYLFKMLTLKGNTKKHNDWSILFKNIFTYTIMLFIWLIIIYFSIKLLFHPPYGEKYKHLLSLLSNFIFPNIESKWSIQHIEQIIYFLENSLEIGRYGGIIVFILLKSLIILFGTFLFYIFINHYTEKYIEFYDRHVNKYRIIPPDFVKIFSYLILFITTIILLYSTIFIFLPDLLSLDHPLQYALDHNKSNSYVANSHKSISDYIPLSIFFAMFGAIAMIGTKDLLENYFTGLSLKIDSPYEEGERVKIDNEIMEVRSLGFRADQFYGINSNTMIYIPHKKLVQSTIINYTKPTLDYRKKITIYIYDEEHGKNLLKEVEKILLLAAFTSIGVKKVDIKNYYEYLNKEIKNEIQKLYESCKKLEKEKQNNSQQIEDTDDLDNLLFYNIDKKEKEKLTEKLLEELFVKDLLFKVKDLDKSKTHYCTIKKIILAIIQKLIEYNKKYKHKQSSLDSNYIIEENIILSFPKNDLEEMGEILIKVSYYYFILAERLWELKKDKDIIASSMEKIQIDKMAINILDVPRVTSSHKMGEDGKLYWEITLLVTLDLAEQSDEIIHHINTKIEKLWEIFNLPTANFKSFKKWLSFS